MKIPLATTCKPFLVLMLTTAFLLPRSSSADVTKTNNSAALNTGGSWVGGVAPGASDVMVFDSTLKLSAYANSITPAPLGGDMSILGIRVAGTVLGQATNENGIVITNASSANTLTIGTSGIDMSAANAVPLNITSKILLGGSQTWKVSDASANITSPPAVLPLPAVQNHSDRYTAFLGNEDEDLYFNALVQGTPFNLGGYTLTLTNAGSTVIDQGYTVSNGTINLTQGTLVFQGGKSRQTTISSNVTINVATNATLRLQTTSGAIVSSAAINLGDGSLFNLAAAGTQGTGAVSNTISVTGSATISQTQNPYVGGNNDITNVIAASISGASGTTLNLLPTQSGTASCVLQLSGTNSGFNGTVNINAVTGIQPVELASATAGSANATWTVNSGNTLQVAGVTVSLGTLNGAGTVSNSTAATTAALNIGAGNFSGAIANAGTAIISLNKSTSSTLILSGTDTYTGPTAVSNGTLLVNGSITSPVTVYSGGTIGGTGTLHSNLLANSGATIAPGSSTTIGTLTVSGATTNSGAVFMKLNRTNSQPSDLLSCAKMLTNLAGATLTVANIGSPLQAGDTFTLFSATNYSGLRSLLGSLTLPSQSGITWNTNSLTNNGTISVAAAPVPVISSLTPLNPTVQCSSNQTFTVTATGQSLTYQWSVNSVPSSGQTNTNFTLGNIHLQAPITVSVTVSNTYGSVVTNSIVTVVDTIPPVVTMNGVNPMTVECHGSFSDPGATAIDACQGSVAVRVSGSVNGNLDGTYYLTYTADDGNGNTNSATRTVIVKDTTPPVISWSFTNLVLNATANCSALMPDVTGTNYILASDACSGANISITQKPTNNALLPLGTNTVVIYVADQSGNTNYSTNTIVVADTIPPVIVLNGSTNETVECHGSYIELGAIATDSCSSVTLTTNGSVNPNLPGLYPIAYIATDAAGNSATNTRNVTVSDSTPPVISWSFTNLVLNATANCSALMPDVTGTNYILAFDACSGANISITQDPATNALLPLGTNTVIISVADQSGNTNYSTNSIVVADTIPPVIVLNGSTNETVECHGSYIELGAIATDSCSSVTLTTNGSVNPNLPGLYPIAYIATDAAGNSATNTRNVTVSDSTPPVISWSFTNLVLNATANCSALMPDVTGTNYILAFDACSGANISITQDPATNALLPLGTNTVIISVADQSGNTNYSTNTIVVADTIPPVIVLNGSTNETVECHGSYIELGAIATDSCSSVTLTTNGSVNPNLPGLYPIAYIATDAAGNSATNTRNVTVSDTTPPEIIWSFTNLVLDVTTNCSAVMPDVTGTNYILAFDACSGANLSITQEPTNNSILPQGTNTVIISVADQSGNTNYSTNTIVVLDTAPPVIVVNGPTNQSLPLYGSYIELGASATDNCTLAGLTTNGTVDASSPGLYTIYYIAVDAAGNSATNTRSVTVAALTPPVIGGGAMFNHTNFQFSISGSPGQPYRVMSTSNLAQPGSWTVIYSNVCGAGQTPFTDTNALSPTVRFYKVVSP